MRLRPSRLVPRTPRARRNLAIAAVAAFAVVTLVLLRFAAEVQALRARRAVGPSWSFPSRVYSDAVPLVAGSALPPAVLVAQLEARGYRRADLPLPAPGTYATTTEGVEIFLRGFLDAGDPEGHGGPERVRVRIRDAIVVDVARGGGSPGAPVPDRDHAPRLEPVLVAMVLDEHRVRRSWVPLSRIPRAVQEAVVASEDRRFFSHLGLDARANLRAFVANFRSGGVRQGGSTITQQLARGLFLGRERTLGRKVVEAILATGLELLLTKHEILEMYLNSVYWGHVDSDAVGGVAEAARAYFGAPVESLGVAQAALLAGMIPAPNTISPFENPGTAVEKRNRVLEDMVETGKLDGATARRLEAAPLGVRHAGPLMDRFPSYVDYVRSTLDGRLSKRAATGWGLAIFTTLDLVQQAEAERGLEDGIARLESWSRRGPGIQGAFLAMDPATASVRAIVGGRGYRIDQFHRAIQAKRQPGSAIKPIVYTAALSGEGYASFTPASTLPDEPRTFGAGRWAWTPHNDGDSYHRTVTLVQALARSLNVATANLVDAIGPGTVARTAERFGLGRLRAVASIGLGTSEVSLLALTRAYSVFAAGGILREPSPLRAVVDGRGRVVAKPEERGEEVIPPALAALMTGLLEDVVQYGVAYPLRAHYGFDRPVAGKTGTTNDYRDAWFVGFTPQLVAGVWIGYDTPRSLHRQAAHSALPVWANIMTRLLGAYPPLPFESDRGLEYHLIDPWTGYLAEQGGCEGIRVPFLPGTAPTLPCGPDMTYLDYGEGEGYLDSLYMADTLASDADEHWNDDAEPHRPSLPDSLRPPEPEPEPEPDSGSGEPQR